MLCVCAFACGSLVLCQWLRVAAGRGSGLPSGAAVRSLAVISNCPSASEGAFDMRDAGHQGPQSDTGHGLVRCCHLICALDMGHRCQGKRRLMSEKTVAGTSLLVSKSTSCTSVGVTACPDLTPSTEVILESAGGMFSTKTSGDRAWLAPSLLGTWDAINDSICS